MGVSPYTVVLAIFGFIAYLGMYRKYVDGVFCRHENKDTSSLNTFKQSIKTTAKKWGWVMTILFYTIFYVFALSASVISGFIFYEAIKGFELGSIHLPITAVIIISIPTIFVESVFRCRGLKSFVDHFTQTKDRVNKLKKVSKKILMPVLVLCIPCALINGIGQGMGAFSTHGLPPYLSGICLAFYFVSLTAASTGVNLDSSVESFEKIEEQMSPSM
jgi:uncharacterized membrane protein YhdT